MNPNTVLSGYTHLILLEPLEVHHPPRFPGEDLGQDKQLANDRAETWLWTSGFGVHQTTVGLKAVGGGGKGSLKPPEWKLLGGTTLRNNVYYLVKSPVRILFNSVVLPLSMAPKEILIPVFLETFKSRLYDHGPLWGKKMSIDKKMGKLWYIPKSENEPIIATCKNSDSILGIWSWMKKKVPWKTKFSAIFFWYLKQVKLLFRVIICVVFLKY